MFPAVAGNTSRAGIPDAKVAFLGPAGASSPRGVASTASVGQRQPSSIQWTQSHAGVPIGDVGIIDDADSRNVSA